MSHTALDSSFARERVLKMVEEADERMDERLGALSAWRAGGIDACGRADTDSMCMCLACVHVYVLSLSVFTLCHNSGDTVVLAVLLSVNS